MNETEEKLLRANDYSNDMEEDIAIDCRAFLRLTLVGFFNDDHVVDWPWNYGDTKLNYSPLLRLWDPRDGINTSS